MRHTNALKQRFITRLRYIKVSHIASFRIPELPPDQRKSPSLEGLFLFLLLLWRRPAPQPERQLLRVPYTRSSAIFSGGLPSGLGKSLSGSIHSISRIGRPAFVPLRWS